DHWTYVSAGAREVGGVLEHEFGHLIAGLFDEYALSENTNKDYPGPVVDGPNCSTNVMSPVWAGAMWTPPADHRPGCRYYGQKIIRPYQDCRMRSDGIDFCAVCADTMTT